MTHSYGLQLYVREESPAPEVQHKRDWTSNVPIVCVLETETTRITTFEVDGSNKSNLNDGVAGGCSHTDSVKGKERTKIYDSKNMVVSSCLLGSPSTRTI